MVSRSSQYQCLLWAPNVHCFEWCARPTTTTDGEETFFTNLGLTFNPIIVQSSSKRLRDPAFWLPLAARASSRNLGQAFLRDSITDCMSSTWLCCGWKVWRKSRFNGIHHRCTNVGFVSLLAHCYFSSSFAVTIKPGRTGTNSEAVTARHGAHIAPHTAKGHFAAAPLCSLARFFSP